MSNVQPTVRVGTRASLLAKSQTAWLIELLKSKWPGLNVETVLISSSGDRIQDRPLYEFGGKGLFTKELEIALLENRIDLAVHSFKDVPVTMPLVDESTLVFASVPGREDVRDILVSRKAQAIDQLPQGAKVGTGSLRRRCQLLQCRPDLQIEMIRGNIDTRIRKMRDGTYDAVILAIAGVKRAKLLEPAEMNPIPLDILLPAAGQGALALQCRKADKQTLKLIAAVDDPVQRACVEAERELVRNLEGDCHSPIAAYAHMEGANMVLDAAVGQRDGQPPVKRGRISHPPKEILPAIAALARELL
jgi:hydroxymethylbilane synthase